MNSHRLRFLIAAALAVPGLCGCIGMTAGQALYWSGLLPREEIKAQFELGDAPVLILLDDSEDVVFWPQILAQLSEEIRKELLTNKAAKDILPAETAVRLRASTPDFDKKGAREVGQLAGADKVLWIEIRDFYAQDQVEEIAGAAKLTVTVKVINSHFESDRKNTRLWPERPDGELVDVEMSGPEVTRAKTVDNISRLLANKCAVAVAKLFYDHEASDFGSGK